MANKKPIRTVFNDSNVATGLAEFQTGETVGLDHGGTGVALSIGSAGQVLKVNSGATALEFGAVEAIINIDTATNLTSQTLEASDQFMVSDGGTEGRATLSQIDAAIKDVSTTLTNKTINASNNTLSNITNSMLSGSAGITNANIANSKITIRDDSSTTDDINLGETLVVAGGSGVTTSISGNTLTIATDGGVVTETSTDTLTNKSISGSTNTLSNIANSSLTNSSVSFGGVSVALGASNATPAFDLTNATSYPTSSLVGTITNDQLTGSIANTKLSNSAVTVGSTSISLGATATTLAGITDITAGSINIAGNVIKSVDSTVVEIGDGDGLSVAGNLTVAGNFTVSGDTTTLSSTNTVITDKLYELANGTTGTPSGDAGIVIERGNESNAFIGYDESEDKFKVGVGTFTGASTGNLTITTGTLLANIEGNVTGAVTGNADTATALASAVNIAGQSFDGSSAINIASTDLSNTSDITLLTSTQTLTNKTLTSPKINEDVAVTATATELNYTDGVTSAIQTQVDAKQATITGAATTIDDADLTASRAIVSD